MSQLLRSRFSQVFDPALLLSLAPQQLFKTVFRSTSESFSRYFDCIANEFEPLLAKGRIAAEVVDVVEETSQARTFVLRPSVHWRAHSPGQYVGVEIEINGVRHRRHYSLSSSVAEFSAAGTVRITVKRVEGGRVSNYLHDHLSIGNLIHISQPSGDFVLGESVKHASADSLGGKDQARAPLFIAAGSGVTPIMAMVESLAPIESRPFSLVYVVRNSSEIIFAERLAELSANLPNFSLTIHETSRHGRFDEVQLAKLCPDLAKQQVFVCGPYAFMELISKVALQAGLTPENIKRELFGLPRSKANHASGGDTEGADTAAMVGQVSFSTSGVVIDSKGSESLLELAEKAGLNPKYGCRAGICHECKCQKTSGRVMNMVTGELIPEDQDQIQACISKPVGDLTISSW